MRTLSVQVSEAEFAELGFEKQTLSLKELMKILSKSAFPLKKTASELPKSQTPIVDSLSGIISLPKNFDYKETLADEIAKKHL